MEAEPDAGKPPSVSPSNETRNRDNCGSSSRRFGSKDLSVYTEASGPEMSRYTVFIEPTATGYSAHVPDLPGCVAAASTLDETRVLIKEAIEFHLEGIRSNGDAVPQPTPYVEQVEVA